MKLVLPNQEVLAHQEVDIVQVDVVATVHQEADIIPKEADKEEIIEEKEEQEIEDIKHAKIKDG